MKEVGREETGVVSLVTKCCSRNVRVSVVAGLPYEWDSTLALFQNIHTGFVTRPTCYSICTRRHYRGGGGCKEAEASVLPLTSLSVEVKNTWSCFTAPQYAFMAFS